jgi:hypothetical protein
MKVNKCEMITSLFDSGITEVGMISVISGAKPDYVEKVLTERRELIAVEKPIDVVLFCPLCKFQHIDEAEPNTCQNCGHGAEYHKGSECYLHDSGCDCTGFKAWLNPPHKSHRCLNPECNHVWRAANIPTNGVEKVDKENER